MDVFLDVVRERRQALLNAAVRGAEELGLFALLSSRDGSRPLRTARWMARELQVSEHRLERLVDLLAAEQVLEALPAVDGRAYRLYAHPGWTAADGGTWNHIANVLRADRPLDHPDARQAHLTYVNAWGARVAPALWDAVEPPCGHLLDVGGGLGAYSLAWVERDPANTATLLELPCAAAAVSAFGLCHPRIDTVFGDIRTLPSLAPHDVVLLANVLHLYGGGECVRILQRAVAALRPGGLLVAKDFHMEEDRSGPLPCVYFALNMTLHTAEGDVHPPRELRRWFRNAGLSDVRTRPLGPAAETIAVTGTHTPTPKTRSRA